MVALPKLSDCFRRESTAALASRVIQTFCNLEGIPAACRKGASSWPAGNGEKGAALALALDAQSLVVRLSIAKMIITTAGILVRR